MKLPKKPAAVNTNTSTQTVQYKKGTPMDHGIHEYNLDAVLPYGKFSGKTFRYIIKHEEWYYNWLCNNQLLVDWRLVQLKQQARKPVFSIAGSYVADNGDIWLGIYEVNN